MVPWWLTIITLIIGVAIGVFDMALLYAGKTDEEEGKKMRR